MSASSAALPPVTHELAESRFLLNVDGLDAVVEYERRDGVLTITLPINEEKSRGKRIPLGKRSSAGSSRAEDRQIEQREGSRETQREQAKESEPA